MLLEVKNGTKNLECTDLDDGNWKDAGKKKNIVVKHWCITTSESGDHGKRGGIRNSLIRINQK